VASPSTPLRASPSTPLRTKRKPYLDWLRGIAVIVMVAAHVTDAWTRVEDRQRDLYGYTVIIAGLAAPLFLFLAGLTLSMAASARATAVGHRAAARMAGVRGLQIFALAFLFRLQAQLLGWGPLVNLLKVDILNIMGLAMLAAAILWSLSPHRVVRMALFALATAALAMSTPLVREAGWLAALPDAMEAYVRPLAGRTNFVLFPWAGFLLGGAITGELVQAARTDRAERRLQLGLLIAGIAGIAAAYALSFQPSIYPNANFWTSSPTFFFMRLGLNTALVPAAWAIDRCHGFARRRWAGLFTEPDVPGRVITTLGRSSLFVYWIHVEMAYGAIALPLRRSMPLELSLLGTLLLCALLYGIVRWKDDRLREVRLTGALRIFAPVLR
jgi:uncharacterized membrane protein